MASFVPPVDATGLTIAPPRRAEIFELDPLGHRALMVSSCPGPVTAHAPVKAFARFVRVAGTFTPSPPLDTIDRFWFVELTPLPTDGLTPVLQQLAAVGAGMPTFYIGAPGLAPPLNDGLPGGVIDAGDQVVDSPTGVVFGATLGTLAVPPRIWARILIDAMVRAGQTDAPGLWLALLTALGGDPALYVLDHRGQPFVGAQFDIEGASPSSVTTDDRADLAPLVPALFDPATRVRLRQREIPYHSELLSGLRSDPARDAPAAARAFAPSALPAPLGALLCCDLGGWFAPRPASVALPRYHIGNTAEPLLDGLETFQRIYDDMAKIRDAAPRPAGQTQFGAWIACWALMDFELVPGDPRSKFRDLVNDIVDNGHQVRLLGSKIFLADSEVETERQMHTYAALLVALVAGLGFPTLIALDHQISVPTFTVIFAVALLLAMLAANLGLDTIEGTFERSTELIAALEGTTQDGGRIALWSYYPALITDNPAAGDLPTAAAEQFVSVSRCGVWHNKTQMLCVPAAGGTPEFVAYLGGIDINRNRIDSSGHRWPPNYHDVHVRITGPAAADGFQTFYERWDFDTLPARRVREEGAFPASGPPPAPTAGNSCPRYRVRTLDDVPDDARDEDVPTPELLALQPGAGDHFVQIARTNYVPAPGNNQDRFWFAPDGEISCRDSILAAIHQAREYIFIEDQYFTPPDSGDEGDEIVDALEHASDRCKALIIVLTQGTGDQLFGRERRNHVVARLEHAWGPTEHPEPGRKFLPMIHSRRILGGPDPIASKGRTTLVNAATESATQLVLADQVRVPAAPSWLWINGELMLLRHKEVGPGDTAFVDVIRASSGDEMSPFLGTWPRAHPVGSPVTFVQLDDVFIHSKTVLIDDVFASIGSANMNRRSLYHDGEINAMIVPGRLAAAADNPVRRIRCRVWADHLGLPPGTAEVALADPIAALPLFERPRAAGNPLAPFKLFEAAVAAGPAMEFQTSVQVAKAIFSGLIELGDAAIRDAMFRTLLDPTTRLDQFFDAPLVI